MGSRISEEDLQALQRADECARQAQFQLQRRQNDFSEALLALLRPATGLESVQRLRKLVESANDWESADERLTDADAQLRETIARISTRH